MSTTTLRTTALFLALTLAAAACGSSSTSTASHAAPHRTVDTTDPVAPGTAPAGSRPTQPIDRLVPTRTGNLHLRCTGQGPVSVLLLSGWDKGSSAWGPFEGSVAQRTRTCAYDRFGTDGSPAPATNQTFATQVADLHAALAAAGEAGPYLVVGHSFGGAEAVTFASTFESEVSGVVLIDASPTDWPAVVCSVPAYEAGCDLMRHPEHDGERLDVFPAFEQVTEVRSLGDLPLTVITAAHRSSEGISSEELARLDQSWAAGQQRWAQLSSRSKVVEVDHTGHEIYLDQPQAVLDEITGALK